MIRVARAEDAELVRGLIREYADGLGVDLSFQDLEAELADPLGFYEVVLLAEGGCVALRRLDEETAEVKRLYVLPNARGTGLGRRLAEAVRPEARALEPLRIARALVQLQEREAVAGGAVAEASALLQRTRRPRQLTRGEQDRVQLAVCRRAGERAHDPGRAVAPLNPNGARLRVE